MAGSVVVAGGTAMLPGFIPRLHVEILRALAGPRYASLRALREHVALLNNPEDGRTPAFAPGALAWVGGSLAGYVTRLLTCRTWPDAAQGAQGQRRGSCSRTLGRGGPGSAA
jgi:hypothetical protein